MQAGDRRGIGSLRAAQGPFELGGRLTVRGQRGGPAGGRGRMMHRRRAIAGRLRVKCHPGIVVAAQSLQ